MTKENLDKLKLILEILETMSNIKYFENIEFKFALVNSLSQEEVKKIVGKVEGENGRK